MSDDQSKPMRCELLSGWLPIGDNARTADDLIRQLFELGRPGWCFRGESDWHETHRSTLGRVLHAEAPMPLDAECDLIHRFLQLSHAFLSFAEHSIISEDVIGTLVLMQHHGAPTRLLDWSMSVWVSAYHACATNQMACGFIYAYSPSAFFKGTPTDWRTRFEPVVRAKTVSKYKQALERAGNNPAVLGLGIIQSTPRMVAQQATYTFGSPGRVDHLEMIGKHLGSEPGRVLVVPGTLKQALMEKLFQMNITGAALYPGIDGVGKTLAEIPRFKIPVPNFGTPIEKD